MIKLSIIIVSYNNVEILRNCLDSIKQFNDLGDQLEVIISDNSPNHDLFETIREEYDWLKIIKNEENRGFGAGNNAGVDISEGEYLLFLNPDTILVEPIFQFTIQKFESDSRLALFGLQLIGLNGEKKASFFSYDKYSLYSIFAEKFRRKYGLFHDKKMFICGADLFVRRTVFIEAGYFDENIFMYKEEADLIKRIKLHSSAKEIAFYNDKQIIHMEGGTESKSDSDSELKVLRRLVASDKYYALKWGIKLKKIIKYRLKYYRFKRTIWRLLFQFKKARQQTKFIIFLKSELKSTKNENA